jgi:outer membrane protein assembly factor BamA
MKKIYNLLSVCFLLLFLESIFPPDNLADTSNSAEAGKRDNDSKEEKVSNTDSLLIFPVIYYTPETKIAGGILGGYYFYPSQNPDFSKPSFITIELLYTELKQIKGEVTCDIFWGGYNNRFTGAIGYSRFPSKFWGIGNDTVSDNEEIYTPEGFWLNLSYKNLVTGGVFLGLDYEYLRRDIVREEQSGGIEWDSIIGKDGGIISRIGFSVTSDSRNHLIYPTSGGYYQVQTKFSTRAIGSEFDFTTLNIDLRRYVTIFDDIVVASQLNGVFNLGDTPFFNAASIGGKYLMRGFYEGRYRDDNMLAFQAECRLPLWWRIGIVAFAGFAQVDDRIEDFRLGGFKFAFGGGLRFLWDREQKLNIRLDVGFADGESALYLTIGEAF